MFFDIMNDTHPRTICMAYNMEIFKAVYSLTFHSTNPSLKNVKFAFLQKSNVK